MLGVCVKSCFYQRMSDESNECYALKGSKKNLYRVETIGQDGNESKCNYVRLVIFRVKSSIRSYIYHVTNKVGYCFNCGRGKGLGVRQC